MLNYGDILLLCDYVPKSNFFLKFSDAFVLVYIPFIPFSPLCNFKFPRTINYN